MFKKTLCFILALSAAAAFTACGKTVKDDITDDETDTEEITLSEPETIDEPEDKEPVQLTPDGFTPIDYNDLSTGMEIKVREVTAAYVGKNYIINLVYSTVQPGRCFARTVKDPMIFDASRAIEPNAEGSAVQFDIPADKLADRNEQIEIGFLIATQADMNAYKVMIDVPAAFNTLEHQSIDIVDVPFAFTPGEEGNNVSSVTASLVGENYHFKISYVLNSDRSFNISYPVDEYSVQVSKDPVEAAEKEPSKDHVDPTLAAGSAYYEFDYPVEKLGKSSSMTIRFYQPDDQFKFDTLDLYADCLTRLAD